MTSTLSPAEGADYLRPYKLPLVAQELASSAGEAAAAAAAIGLPVALKLIATGVSHKSDVGGVRLAVDSLDRVREIAGQWLLEQPEASVLVQPMAAGVIELIVGIARDPTFGPVVAVGLGGTLAELLDDVSLGIPPLSRRHALEMLGSLRGSALLDGFRGSPAADRESLVELLLAVSAIAADEDLLELDLNPVLVGRKGEGCVVVDNRVVLRWQPTPSEPVGERA